MRLLLCLLACTPRVVRPTQSAPTLATLLDAQCTPCHEGFRPDARQAMRAALLVASQVMPKGRPLAAPVRRELLEALCGALPRPADCLAVVFPPATHEWAKPPAAFLRRVGEPEKSGELFRAESERKAENGASPATPLDSAFVLRAAALALERCAVPEEFDACARRVLDPAALRFP